ncbi:MAG: PfkB family carbohydrate kinase [Planctomycetota bacterium]|jgi:rfaE bifunctional protein kinase chain/domain
MASSSEISEDASVDWLRGCLAKLATSRVAIFGDFCLDAYWRLDPDDSEISIETGLPVRRVRSQQYTLGGAGNVLANTKALGVAEVVPIGAVGDDLFGREMLRIMEEMGVETGGLIFGPPGWQTLVYTKPLVEGVEENRVDFGAFNTHDAAMMDALETLLDEGARRCDVIILNQQVPNGLGVGVMIDRINGVIERNPDCRYMVDSRNHAGAYRGAVLKMNEIEAAHHCGLDESVDVLMVAESLRERTGQDVFVTCGAEGIVVAQEGESRLVPGIEVIEPVDTVGAGDTVMASLAACLGVGIDPVSAARVANLAASVTVRKLQTTGVASPAEIEQAAANANHIHEPILAEEPNCAEYLPGSAIEIIRNPERAGRIRHAIFDHDGTLSTLRQGWDDLMAPMMVAAVLGDIVPSDPDRIEQVKRDVTQLIEYTTGYQTLRQMSDLVELVRHHGFIPEDQILDAQGYKAIYYESLMQYVNDRLNDLSSGKQTASDFEIHGARSLLEVLKARGVSLYLASGTDEADVFTEAKVMGYADLFDGIHGAVGDINREAKSEVIERVMRENTGDEGGFVVFGDGPVEMREARKRGGIAIGVASDEISCRGLNVAKRRRLIRAGADAIIADYAEAELLLQWLNIE